MKSYMLFGALVIIFTLPYVFLTTAKEEGPSTQFDWSIFKALSRNSKNVIYSPISLRIILTLLCEGSSGFTKTELLDVLDVANETQHRYYYQKLIKILREENSDYDVNLRTKIFLDSHVQPIQGFASKAEDFYNTTINATNFRDSKHAADQINSWVYSVTRGKISKLVNPGEIESAVLLVVNALYFKGVWDEQFKKEDTGRGGFYTTPEDIIRVDYMKKTAKYDYAESKQLDAKILRIPYKDHKYSLTILLPKTKAGLSMLIQNMNAKNLQSILKTMDFVPVEVYLPKFKFSFQSSYADILQDHGVINMFQQTASLAGISRGTNLYVTNILQKAGIELNEEGSVVYAASDVQLGNKFGEIEYVFNVTHPFAFFIQENYTGSILFVGKVENPLITEEILLPNRFYNENNTQQHVQEIVTPTNLFTTSKPSKYNMRVVYTPTGFKIERV